MALLPDLDYGLFDNDDPHEQCGVILWSDASGFTIVPLPNRHPEPDMWFRVHRSDLQRVLDDYPDATVYGYAHTHPEGQRHAPSRHDIESLPAGVLGVVYHPSTGKAVWYTSEGILRRGYKPTRRTS